MGFPVSAGSFPSGYKHAVIFYLLKLFLRSICPLATVPYLSSLLQLVSSKELYNLALSPSFHPVSPKLPRHWCCLSEWQWPSPSGHFRSSCTWLPGSTAPLLIPSPLHPALPWLPGPHPLLLLLFLSLFLLSRLCRCNLRTSSHLHSFSRGFGLTPGFKAASIY